MFFPIVRSRFESRRREKPWSDAGFVAVAWRFRAQPLKDAQQMRKVGCDGHQVPGEPPRKAGEDTSGLLAYAEAPNDVEVTLRIDLLQIVQQTPTPADQHQ
jgi:hypothetical protein